MRATLLGLASLLFGGFAWASDPRLEHAVEGARLFRAECAPCHGTTARGGGDEAWLFDPPPPNLRIAQLERRDPNVLVLRILDAPGNVVPSPRALAASAARTDALVSYVARLPRVNWDRAQRGRSLYIDRCERCHGAFGRPAPSPSDTDAPRPRDLAAAPFPVDDKQLARLIRHEREGMPHLPESVTDGDVQALVAFVRLLSPGYETYQVSCATCHGDEGIPPPGRKRPTVVFDGAYLAAHDTQFVRSRVWHMLGEGSTETMPHFRGVLTEAQARAIVDYLRARSERPSGKRREWRGGGKVSSRYSAMALDSDTAKPSCSSVGTRLVSESAR
jgi:mono/diheme cytochrome c family protein